MAVVPVADVNAPEQLGARFASVLEKLGTREVSAEALLETLRLEALDWGFDNGIDAHDVDLSDTPVTAGSERDEA